MFRCILLALLVTTHAVSAEDTDQPTVKLGIDVLRESDFEPIRGKRVGLVAHPASRDSRYVATVDVLHETDDCELAALFGPEHGVYGDAYAGDRIADSVDEHTGLPAYSLFGKGRKPTPEMLEGLDALVFDLQDIGSRSYTYISTMRACLLACAEQDIAFVVLDRPNPLGGQRIEGGMVEPGFESFISYMPVPYVHGMTMGELARLVRDRDVPDYDKLTVVPMHGWSRDMLWPDTGLRWVVTSPHIPDADSCAYYTATGIVGELDSISIGVGYTMPFELFGAPWIDGERLSEALSEHWNDAGKFYRARSDRQRQRVPPSSPPQGVTFRPIWFKPFYSRFKDEVCSGVQVHIDPRTVPSLIELNYRLIEAVGPKGVFGRTERHGGFDKATGSDAARTHLMRGRDPEQIFDTWRRQCDEFRQQREPYLLYE